KGTLNVPFGAVMVIRSHPLARFLTVTSACATTAALVSSTTPEITPVGVCATAGIPAPKSRIHLSGIDCPSLSHQNGISGDASQGKFHDAEHWRPTGFPLLESRCDGRCGSLQLSQQRFHAVESEPLHRT